MTGTAGFCRACSCIPNGIGDIVRDPAVWELMYFDKSCADEVFREKHDI